MVVVPFYNGRYNSWYIDLLVATAVLVAPQTADNTAASK